MRSVVTLLAVVTWSSVASAGGTLVRASGSVERGANKKRFLPLSVGDSIKTGDWIQTGADGSARFLMSDDSILNLGPNSEMRVRAYSVRGKKRRVNLQLSAGRLWARVTRLFSGKRNFEIKTENAVAGVRGTEFVVDTNGEETTVTVLSGEVAMRGRRGPPVTLSTNSRGEVFGRKRAVQVALDPAQTQSALEGAGPPARLSNSGSEERLQGSQDAAEQHQGRLSTETGTPGETNGSRGADGGVGGPRGESDGPRPTPGPGSEPTPDASPDSPGPSGPGSGERPPASEPGEPSGGPSPTAEPAAPAGGPQPSPEPGGASSSEPVSPKPPASAPPAKAPPTTPRPTPTGPTTLPRAAPGLGGAPAVDPGSRVTRVRVRVQVRR